MKRIKSDGQLHEGATTVSRRSFLTGAAIAATGIAAVGLAGCAPQQDSGEAEGGVVVGGTRYTKYPNPDEIGIVH